MGIQNYSFSEILSFMLRDVLLSYIQFKYPNLQDLCYSVWPHYAFILGSLTVPISVRKKYTLKLFH
jgi:hypothetical protein